MLTGLDVKEAATALGVRPATVLKRIQKRSLKADKEGGVDDEIDYPGIGVI